jgi:hypothetical protein
LRGGGEGVEAYTYALRGSLTERPREGFRGQEALKVLL